MSSNSNVLLTEEQEKFLTSLEDEFKDRYTEKDEEFRAVLNEKPPLPPVIENWKDYKPRSERRENYRYNFNRYYSGHHYEDDRRRDDHYDRRRDQYYNDHESRYSHSSRQDHKYRDQHRYGKQY